jgi:hypothetical protein
VHGQAVEPPGPGPACGGGAPDGLVEAFSVDGRAGLQPVRAVAPRVAAADNPVSVQMLQAFGVACAPTATACAGPLPVSPCEPLRLRRPCPGTPYVKHPHRVLPMTLQRPIHLQPSSNSGSTSNRVTEIECLVPDLTGVARGKILPREKFTEDRGMRLPEAVVAMGVTGEFPEEGPYYDVISPPTATCTCGPTRARCASCPGPPTRRRR